MEIDKAVDLVSNSGGDYSKIPASQLFDVLSALHGTFEFSSTYNSVFKYIKDNEDVAKAVLEDKESATAIKDVMNFDVQSLEELSFKKDIFTLFDNDSDKSKALDDQIVKMFNGYSWYGFQPSLADLQDIMPLANKVNTDTFSGQDKAAFLSQMGKLKDSYLLAEGSDQWDLLSKGKVEKNVSDLEALYAGLSDDEKKIELLEKIEIEKHIDNAAEKVSANAENLVNNSNEWLPSAKYRKELESFLSDETMRKLAMDPDFADKYANAQTPEEKKQIFFEKRNEVARDYVKELVLNQESYNFVQSFEGGVPTKVDMQNLSDKVEEIVKNFEKGVVPKGLKFSKEIALATLNAKIADSVAITREISKRVGISSFYDKAKARQQRFAKDHPVIYKAGKNLAIAGAIAGVTVLQSTVGSALSTAYAVHKTHTAYKAMKAKYVNDPLYKHKTFSQYVADHKLEMGAVVITGVMAALPAIGLAGKLGVIEPDKVAIRVARATAVLALGVTNATNMFIKAKTKKEKVMAFAVLGASVGSAAAAALLPAIEGKELMGKVTSKLSAFFGGSKVSDEVLQGNVDTSAKGDLVSVAKGNSIQVAKVDSIQVTKGDSIPVAKGDSIQVTKGDSIQVAKGDSIQVAKGDSIQVAKGDSTNVAAPESKGANTPVVEQSTTRADVGQGNISDKDWSRIKIRSVQAYGAEQIKEWNVNINSGQVEGIPAGMSKEEFIYKLGQLQKLAPVVHKESIDLMLRDLNCDGTVLTTEQIAQVQESLKTIDIKGEYHGFEPTERTCNRVTGIKVDVNCDDKTVNVKQTVEYGDCNKPAPAPVVVQEEKPVQAPVVQEEKPAPAPVQEPVVQAKVEAPAPVVEQPVVEKAVGKEVVIEGVVTNKQGVMGDGGNETSLDKMAEKGVIAGDYYGDEAPRVLNDARLVHDAITKDMLAKNQAVELNLNSSDRNDAEYNKLLVEAIDKKEVVAAPIDKSTGQVTYDKVAPENQGERFFVKKGTPLHDYIVEKQEKAVRSAVIKSRVLTH